MTFQMNKNPPFEESELANTIGLLVIRSSHLDYLLRHALVLFTAEDITDNRIYQKAELIVTKFGKISQVAELLKDLAPMVLCRWYWDDFNSLFEEVATIFEKRNSHCHNIFHILDEDSYQMSSATTHYKVMTRKPDPKKQPQKPSKLHEKHSLKDLRDVVKRTSECISQLEYLTGTPSKGPILRIDFLKLPEEERMKIAERENRSTKLRTRRGNSVGKKKSGAASSRPDS